jgi:hypothetical protein
LRTVLEWRPGRRHSLSLSLWRRLHTLEAGDATAGMLTGAGTVVVAGVALLADVVVAAPEAALAVLDDWLRQVRMTMVPTSRVATAAAAPAAAT